VRLDEIKSVRVTREAVRLDEIKSVRVTRESVDLLENSQTNYISI